MYTLRIVGASNEMGENVDDAGLTDMKIENDGREKYLEKDQDSIRQGGSRILKRGSSLYKIVHQLGRYI